MTSEHSSSSPTVEQVETVEVEQPQDIVVRKDVVRHSLLHRLSQFWPFSIVVRACRGVWWMLGLSPKTSAAVATPARQSLTGRKRLRWVTRLLMFVLPRRVQRALGYPLPSSIGRSLSPEVRVSPTKPCGKGSKRKQDELDEDEEEEQQSWVEALTQELNEDAASEEDPDYEPITVETESDEYCSHNNTESDIEYSATGLVVIEDLKTDAVPIDAN